MSLGRDDLQKAAGHIAFDMYHFRCYARLYKTPVDQPFKQAVIYSLLLHFRVLLAFFYGPPRQDDVWVGHFKVLPEFAASFPKIDELPEAREVSKHLNKRLAHFTATRWREKQPEMPYYAKYFDGVEKLVLAFQAALPDDLRQVFKKRTQEFEKRDRSAINSDCARLVRG